MSRSSYILIPREGDASLSMVGTLLGAVAIDARTFASSVDTSVGFIEDAMVGTIENATVGLARDATIALRTRVVSSAQEIPARWVDGGYDGRMGGGWDLQITHSRGSSELARSESNCWAPPVSINGKCSSIAFSAPVVEFTVSLPCERIRERTRYS